MVEYGNGIAQGPAGQVGGGQAAGGSVDIGASIGGLVDQAAHTLSTLTPTELLLAVLALFVLLLILRRAF